MSESYRIHPPAALQTRASYGPKLSKNTNHSFAFAETNLLRDVSEKSCEQYDTYL